MRENCTSGLSGGRRLALRRASSDPTDTYDALTSDRSYRKSETPDEAMKLIIEGSGTHFSRPIVKVFAQLTGMLPVGSVVEMDTGELGVVYKPNTDDIYRPQVKLFSATDESIAEYKLVDVAKREEDGSYPRTIRRSVDPSECQVDISYFLYASRASSLIRLVSGFVNLRRVSEARHRVR
jgi:hypothetical protein